MSDAPMPDAAPADPQPTSPAPNARTSDEGPSLVPVPRDSPSATTVAESTAAATTTTMPASAEKDATAQSRPATNAIGSEPSEMQGAQAPDAGSDKGNEPATDTLQGLSPPPPPAPVTQDVARARTMPTPSPSVEPEGTTTAKPPSTSTVALTTAVSSSHPQPLINTDAAGGGGRGEDDEERDQLESDDDLALASVPRRSTVAVEPSDAGTATGQGGATAGPGPNTKKRPLPSGSPSVEPGASASGSTAAHAAQLHKKRPRIATSVHLANGSYIPPPLPHYTVVRSTGTNSKQNPHVIRLVPGVTDGDDGRWPPDAERDPKNKRAGKTYYYECQPKEVGRHKAMLEKLGEEMAKRLNLVPKGAKPEAWILESLPEDYLFTVHHCVTASGQDRVDVYVFGSPATAKFRTANELTPHLFWLITHGPDDRLKCTCKYCSKKSQGDVNKVEGLEVHGGPKAERSASQPGGGHGTGVGPAAKDKKPTRAAVAAAVSADSKPSTTKPGVRSRTYNADEPEPSYSGAFVDKGRDSDLLSGALYRIGELVWAELPVPLRSTDPAWHGLELSHWPAIVSSRNEKTKAELIKPYVSGQVGGPRFRNHKRWTYHVKFVATSDEADAMEEPRLRPWLGYPPPDGLFSAERLKHEGGISKVWDGRHVHKAVLEGLNKLEEAVTPAAFAMQIAAHIVESFSLVDRYTIREQHVVLARPEIAREEEQSIKAQLDNWQYQSVYLGGERIWVNDFVRVTEDGALPPGHVRSESSKAKGKGSNTALFLLISSIYKDTETSAAKVSGHLYEMRDLRMNEAGAGTGSIGGVAGAEGAMSMFEKVGNAIGNLVSGGKGPATTTNGTSTTEGAGANSISNSDSNANGAEPSGSASPASSLTTHSPPRSPRTNLAPSAPVSYVPPAPEGYEFHRLTDASASLHVDIEYIAGRYYPLPKGSNSKTTIDRVLKSVEEEDEDVKPDGDGDKAPQVGRTEEQRSMALAGLLPAKMLYMKCESWYPDRFEALVAAERQACEEVGSFFLAAVDSN
ncbi:hypothetical protein JCM10212_004699 [Sporobolomyces blumeae]